MQPSLDQLSDYGSVLFEQHYAERPGRESDGKKHQDRESVAWGWLRLAVCYRMRALFKPECHADLEFGT